MLASRRLYFPDDGLQPNDGHGLVLSVLKSQIDESVRSLAHVADSAELLVKEHFLTHNVVVRECDPNEALPNHSR